MVIGPGSRPGSSDFFFLITSKIYLGEYILSIADFGFFKQGKRKQGSSLNLILGGLPFFGIFSPGDIRHAAVV